MGLIQRPYRVLPGEPFPSPILDLELLGPSGRVSIAAMVDSGAVRPIFPIRAAQDAGIDLSTSFAHPIQYGGSKTSGKIARARIEISGVIELAVDTSIVFVERLDLPYALLGRIRFFDRFNEVSFLQKVGPPRFELRW